MPRPDPPAPSIDALEAVMAAGWPGTRTDRLGGWWLRAGAGFTGRANSALPVGDPGRPLPAAIDAVVAFYVPLGLPPAFQVPWPSTGPGTSAIDRELARRGWTADAPVAVLTAPLARVLDAPVAAGLGGATFADSPGADWLAGYHYRGAVLPPEAAAVLQAGPGPVFVQLDGPDGRLGVVRGVVHDGWLGVTALTVDPTARRRGVGRHLMGELARWARPRGAHSVHLQVVESNAAALSLYAGLGFTRHHGYHYRRAPGPARRAPADPRS